jgi:branched-chain amino acid transport system permease protein
MPYVFSFGLTFQIVIMLIIGGAGTMVGPVIGAVLLVAFKYAVKPLEESLRLYGFAELIYAALLILMMIKRPKGIVGGERQLLVANKAALYLRRAMHGLRLDK